MLASGSGARLARESGVVYIAQPLDRPEDLLNRADRAMFARKRVRNPILRAV